MKSSIIKQCFFFGFFIALSCESIYPMFGWFGSAPAQQPQQQVWIKTKAAQANQQATSAVLDTYLKEDKHSSALELFDIFLNQHNEDTKYALRWAKSTADKGYFSIQYRLIKYYQSLLNENIVGFTMQDIEYIYELIMKNSIMLQMAVNWFNFKNDIAMKKKCSQVIRCVYQEYCDVLDILLPKYTPLFDQIYSNVLSWVTKNKFNLERTYPTFLFMAEVTNAGLKFSPMNSNINEFVSTATEKLKMNEQNGHFLKKSEIQESNSQSWDVFYRFFKNAN